MNNPSDGFFWERKPEKGWAGERLATLRRGLGREPGTVPEMWGYYTKLTPDGSVSRELRAEHCALALFGLHQQSQAASMHRPGVGFGTAIKALRNSGRYSEAAVDARMERAATASTVRELDTHARSLITMLKTITPPQGLDYTALYRNLVGWQDPAQVGRVRRAWGANYFWRSAEDLAATPNLNA